MRRLKQHHSAVAAEQSSADWVTRQGGHDVAGLAPADVEAAYQRARQMLAANLTEPARAVFEALLMLQPTSVRFVRALGITYLRRQAFKKARAMFEYGLGLDAYDVVMQLLLGECLLFCGERERGVQALELALTEAAARAANPQLHVYVMRAQKCLTMTRGSAP